MTLESTPPLTAQRTRSPPTSFRIFSTSRSTNEPEFQLGLHRQTRNRKLWIISAP
jgi:hypothetical protein